MCVATPADSAGEQPDASALHSMSARILCLFFTDVERTAVAKQRLDLREFTGIASGSLSLRPAPPDGR